MRSAFRYLSILALIAIVGAAGTGFFVLAPGSAQTEPEKADAQKADTDFNKSLEDLRNAAAETRDQAFAAASAAYEKLKQAYADMENKAAGTSAEMRKRWSDNKGSFDTLNQDAERRLEELNKAAAESWDEAKKKAADALQQMSDWLSSKSEPQQLEQQQPSAPSEQKT